MKIQTIVCSLLTVVSMTAAEAAKRVDSSIAEIVSSGNPLEAAVERGFAVRDGRVQVVVPVAGSATGDLARWLVERGALFVTEYDGRVQAFVTPDVLRDLPERADVLDVERPLYALVPEPVPQAPPSAPKLLAVTSEGVEPMNVAAWRNEGFDGSGVRIGVIDVEFYGWDDLLGVELPAERTTYQAFGGSSVSPGQVHGTACAEIVHDIAPEAELYLAHIRTLGDFYAAMDWYETVGVDVVTMSVSWFGAGPGDGTGSAADRITSFVAASDAVFFTSAGNERRSHWQGQTFDDDGDGWVDFAPGDSLNELTFTIESGERVAVNLAWADWTAPDSDYSLHLFRLDGSDWVQVAVSDRAQTGLGHQTPYEQISHTAPDGGRFAVRIGRSGVTGIHDMEMFSIDSDLENRVAAGSLTFPGDVERVAAVAAINYNPPYTLRSFSSAGPSNGPGGTISGGLTKPDYSAFDGVSTVSYGARNYFGTSAATPHAAGAAALVRQAEPGMDAEEVRGFLAMRAQDLGIGGLDNDYGWGRVFLGQTPGSTCTFAIDPTSVSEPASGGGGIIRITTDEGCPWNTSSMADWIEVSPSSGIGSRVIGYTVDENPGEARVGEVIIADLVFTVSQEGVAPPPSFSTMVAGIAETEGAAGTRWRSDLAILNRGATTAEVEITYRHEGGSAQSSLSVRAGEVVELVNVAGLTFGSPDSAGSVEVLSSAPVTVTARTFNDAPQGTFGQSLPGVTVEDGLAPGEVAVLTQIGSDDDIRTNIGFVDLGGQGALARIRLFDGNGDELGSELGEIIAAGGWSQVNRVFRAANAGDCRGCYALVDLVGDQGPVWAYASVVDNDSGDPTTIPMVRLGGGAGPAELRYLVSGVAETAGANDTRWKSDLALLNLSGSGATAEMTYRHGDGSASSNLTLADGELREFSNVAAEIFSSPDSSGVVDVAADGALVVTSRTYNDAPDGTFGQSVPGVEAAEAMPAQTEGVLSQLASDDDFRTNIGYVNFNTAECSVQTTLFDNQGTVRRTYFTAVPAGRWVQVNRVYRGFCPDGCPLGYAVVKGVSPGCLIWTYASVVDNGSGDPTTVPAVIR
jgi:hypothetical protein